MTQENTEKIPVEGLLTSWEQGVVHFNRGYFWHAHESWERGWTSLPSPQKEYVQALIQACAVFHLLFEKSRVPAALSLCQSALGKLDLVPNEYKQNTTPRLEIPGLEKVLLDIQKEMQPSSRDIGWVRPVVQQLKAHLVR